MPMPAAAPATPRSWRGEGRCVIVPSHPCGLVDRSRVRAHVAQIAVDHGPGFDLDILAREHDVAHDFGGDDYVSARRLELLADAPGDIEPAAGEPGTPANACGWREHHIAAGEQGVVADLGVERHRATRGAHVIAQLAADRHRAAGKQDVAFYLIADGQGTAGGDHISFRGDGEVDDAAGEINVLFHRPAARDRLAELLGQQRGRGEQQQQGQQQNPPGNA
jgi:hypothetical protein